MKKKNYIQPHIMVVMLKQSVALLSASDNFKTSVSWNEAIEDDEDID